MLVCLVCLGYFSVLWIIINKEELRPRVHMQLCRARLLILSAVLSNILSLQLHDKKPNGFEGWAAQPVKEYFISP